MGDLVEFTPKLSDRFRFEHKPVAQITARPTVHQQLVSVGFRLNRLYAPHEKRQLSEDIGEYFGKFRIVHAVALNSWSSDSATKLFGVHALYTQIGSHNSGDLQKYANQLRAMPAIGPSQLCVIPQHTLRLQLGNYTSVEAVHAGNMSRALENARRMTRIYPCSLVPAQGFSSAHFSSHKFQ